MTVRRTTPPRSSKESTIRDCGSSGTPSTRGRERRCRPGRVWPRERTCCPSTPIANTTRRDVRRLVEPVVAGRASVVFGIRLSGVHTVYQSYRYALGNRLMTLWANVLYDAAMTDMHTCLKLVPLPFFRSVRLRERGFGLDTELAAAILATGARPFEVPVSYYGRSHLDGKKITWRDGVHCLWIVARSRMYPRSGYPVAPPREWHTEQRPSVNGNGLRSVPMPRGPPPTCTMASSRRSAGSRAANRTHAAGVRVGARPGGVHRDACIGCKAHGFASPHGLDCHPRAGRGVRGSAADLPGAADPRRPRCQRPIERFHGSLDRAGADDDCPGRTLRVAFSISIHDAGDGGAYRWALETTAAKPVGSRPSGTVALEAGERATIPVRAAVRCDAGATRAWVGVRVDPEPAASVGTWLECPERRP